MKTRLEPILVEGVPAIGNLVAWHLLLAAIVFAALASVATVRIASGAPWAAARKKIT